MDDVVQSIIDIFSKPENEVDEVVAIFQEFVDLIPLPEGVEKITLLPHSLDDTEPGRLIYAVRLVWRDEDAFRTSLLFRFSVDVESGYPVSTHCTSTQTALDDDELSTNLEILAREVKGLIQAQLKLKRVDRLQTSYLCKVNGKEPTLQFMVEK